MRLDKPQKKFLAAVRFYILKWLIITTFIPDLMRLDKPPKSLWQEINDYFDTYLDIPPKHLRLIALMANLMSMLLITFVWLGILVLIEIGLADVYYRVELYFIGQEAQATITGAKSTQVGWTNRLEYNLAIERIDPNTGQSVKELRLGEEEMWFFTAIYYVKQGNQTVRFLPESLEKRGMGQPRMQVGHPTNIMATWYWFFAFLLWYSLRKIEFYPPGFWLMLCRWVWRRVWWAWHGVRQQ